MTPEERTLLACAEYLCCVGLREQITKQFELAEHDAILAERERCASLPRPPARITSPAVHRITHALSAGEIAAYIQAWQDYTAAIREPTDE